VGIHDDGEKMSETEFDQHSGDMTKKDIEEFTKRLKE